MIADELTNEQIAQQDAVEDAILGVLLLTPRKVDYDDKETICIVREAIIDALHLTEEEQMAFYPWLLEDEDDGR